MLLPFSVGVSVSEIFLFSEISGVFSTILYCIGSEISDFSSYRFVFSSISWEGIEKSPVIIGSSSFILLSSNE